jgi:hypothetical protein
VTQLLEPFADRLARLIASFSRLFVVVVFVLAIGCHERRQTSTSPASGLPPAVVQVPAQRESGRAKRKVRRRRKQGCGSERWAVKLGYDAAARSVGLVHWQPTTVDTLRALSPPPHVKTSPRTAPPETTVFRLAPPG